MTIHKSRIFFVIFFIVFILLFSTSCSNKHLTTVNLNEVTRSIFYAPQYVAMELGFFDQEHLEIKLTTAGGSDKTMTSILSSQAHIGLVGPETCIYVYNEGRENCPIIFAQITKRDGSFIVGHSNSFKWDDLKGKSIIAGRKGGLPEMTLQYLLKKNKIELGKDIKYITNIQFNLMGTAFSSGIGDFVTLFEPTASIIQNESQCNILKSIGLESGEIPYTCYCATKEYISQNKDIIKGFTTAIYKGQKWIHSHSPEEIAQTIISYFPDTDITLISKSVRNYLESDIWNSDPKLKEESFDFLQKVIMDAGELKKLVKFDAIVDTSFADNIFEK